MESRHAEMANVDACQGSTARTRKNALALDDVCVKFAAPVESSVNVCTTDQLCRSGELSTCTTSPEKPVIGRLTVP